LGSFYLDPSRCAAGPGAQSSSRKAFQSQHGSFVESLRADLDGVADAVRVLK
jgi:hypothetical protein